MRKKATLYPEINKLPKKAVPVRIFAEQSGISTGHVYTKLKLYEAGTSKITPGYTIHCHKGENGMYSNYVIPN